MDKHNHTTVYAAIAAGTIVSIVANYFLIQMPKIEEVGGRANYKLYQKMVNSPKFAENVKQSLQSQEGMLDGNQPTPDKNQPSADPKTAGTITQDEITQITKGTYIRGNESAEILWVEYSDLECAFCKRLHDSGAIKNLEAKYGDKLAYTFKHYPLPFHQNALPAALNAECVGEIGGSSKFYAFIESVFIKGAPSQSVINSTLSEIKVDTKKVQKCVDSNKFKSKIDADQNEGSSKFGVNGTPGNVLINTKTGKYEVVSGAQPESNFDAAIVRLMAE